MNFNRLLSLLAVPFASLFLILTLCTMVVRRSPSAGFYMPIIRLHHHPDEPTDCGGRSEFLRLTKDGRTWINEAEIPHDKIASTLAEMMKNRVERIVFIEVDSDLPYGQFTELMDKASGSIEDLHVIVISGETRRTFETSRQEFSEAFEKGDTSKIAPSLNAILSFRQMNLRSDWLLCFRRHRFGSTLVFSSHVAAAVLIRQNRSCHHHLRHRHHHHHRSLDVLRCSDRTCAGKTSAAPLLDRATLWSQLHP